MAITDKTRKILWARSGNRCAWCKCLLVSVEQVDGDKASVIGEEAHIHAQSLGGPRYDASVASSQVDDYENLLLLCRNHHKIVDDQQEAFSATQLRNIKRSHEEWVRDTLDRSKSKEPKPAFLNRLLNGKSLVDLIASAHMAFDFDFDAVETSQEVELVGRFLQRMKDIGECWTDLESKERVEASFSLDHEIRKMEEAGFWVFGGKKAQPYTVGDKTVRIDTSVIRVIRQTNTGIFTL